MLLLHDVFVTETLHEIGIVAKFAVNCGLLLHELQQCIVRMAIVLYIKLVL